MIADGFVRFLLGAEGDLVFVENSVDFGDLGCGGGSRMDGIEGAVEGSDERNIAGVEEVCSGEEGESEMSMDAISGIQKNGGGVGVELGQGKTDSSVGGWRGGMRRGGG